MTTTATQAPPTVLSATGIVKRFSNDPSVEPVLRGVDVRVREGEFLAIMGPSGSGKSTLLYALSGMDAVDEGSVMFGGESLTALDAKALADRRRAHMGFVFQQPAFLRDLSLLENIVLTSALDGVGSEHERVARAEQLLEGAGILPLRDRRPNQVSGGQLQRAGICRAIMRSPRIVFGDEPTGALNSQSAAAVMAMLVEVNRSGTALVIVTHDARVAAQADRVLFLRDGEIAAEETLRDLGEHDERARLARVSGHLQTLGI